MKLEGRSERPYGRLLQDIVEQRFVEFVTRGVERMPSCAEQRMLRSSPLRSSAPLSTAIAHQHRERPQPVGSRQCAVGSSTYCEPPTAYCAIPNWQPIVPAVVQSSRIMKVTRRYRQCNYDLARRTIGSYPQSVVRERVAPSRIARRGFRSAHPREFPLNPDHRADGVNWHRGVF